MANHKQQTSQMTRKMPKTNHTKKPISKPPVTKTSDASNDLSQLRVTGILVLTTKTISPDTSSTMCIAPLTAKHMYDDHSPSYIHFTCCCSDQVDMLMYMY